ncbi:SAM-dependent methyltransferase [Thiocapsa imhoffii]|uniref:SAM-dependent methyltransferase n=1 Tax=Thiocapsa imhoffii TaxID=382777 RepID=A0A9X0WKT5_9GAMM|nr:methyltransferase domain-containing protein [Thiocapsa imhoffii]MBK1646260.1 SAM-dependent methyltransferase [Thiocapsa imhoffii]
MTARMAPGSSLAGLQDWYRSPLGTEVAALESACVQHLLSDTFGYYLVQIGVTESFRDALASSRIRHRILMPCERPSGSQGCEIVARPHRLPLATDAIDAILLPHTLDYAPEPQVVLREVERVLIPEGRVIILGFNALSAWGLVALLRRRAGRMPWCGRFSTAYRIAGALSLLGFDIERREHIMFRPPLRRALGPNCALFDTLGRRLWPILGGVYVIRAVKRVSTLTPLRPAWGKRRALLPGGAVEPTTRESTHV